MDVGTRTMWIYDTLATKYNLTVSVYRHGSSPTLTHSDREDDKEDDHTTGGGGVWWTRLSAQVYTSLSDFEYCGTVLRDVCRQIEADY